MTALHHDRAKVVLITGCSSGIGRAAADLLARRGHRVCATARRTKSIGELRRWAQSYGDRAMAVGLDVDDPCSIDAAVEALLQNWGKVDCLVNNAGFGQFGTVEDLPIDMWRQQFETNVMGAIGVTQAVLEPMRCHGRGRIVTLSSLAAYATLPLMGAYSASKAALDAAMGALRMEVAPFGIDVVLIEPGPVRTAFRANVRNAIDRERFRTTGVYDALYAALDDYWRGQYGQTNKTGDDVARLVRKAVEARRPRARYRITAAARVVPHVLPFVPDKLVDSAIGRRLGWRSR